MTMLHVDREKESKTQSLDLLPQDSPAQVQPATGQAMPATQMYTREPSAQAVSVEVSHWAEEGGERREWPEADGDVARPGAAPRAPASPLQDPTKNPDPKNEYAPNATYGEVKGTVAVKGEGDAHEFAPNDVEQGALGDCYFVAQLAAQARANPERIRHLIQDNGDGTYTITLHLKRGGRKRVATPIVVDSQFPHKDGGVAYAKPGDRGDQGPELWAMLVEKAFAKVTGSFEQIRGSKTPDGDVFAMMSGVESQEIRLASMSRERVLDTLTKAVAAGRGVAFSAHSKSVGDELVAEMKTEGVVANHCYSLEGVDAKAGTVSLRNPWGVKHLDNFPIEKVQKYFRAVDIGAK